MRMIMKYSIVAVALFALLLVSTARAVEDPAVLWFYSVDPPLPLPDPQTWDPNYVSSSSDPWINESVVVIGDWSEPFSLWLAVHQFESLDTKLVISINTEAKAAIDNVTVVTPAGTTVITSWIMGGPPGPLAPHGVFNSAEFAGYAEAPVGNLYSPPDTPYKAKIDITIGLKAPVTASSKMHFDAYGHDSQDRPTTSPYSHDATFRVPEVAGVIIGLSAMGGALGVYRLRRRR